jgi:hypothetical protein
VNRAEAQPAPKKHRLPFAARCERYCCKQARYAWTALWSCCSSPLPDTVVEPPPDDPLLDSVAASFEDSEVAAAIDRALELLEERREAAREGRSTHEQG